MNVLFLFVRMFYFSTRNKIKTLSFIDELKSAIFILMSISFLVFLYLLYYRLIFYLDNVPIIGPHLTGKFLSLIFLTVWWMVLFSSLNTTYGNFYFSEDINWLFSQPISLRTIFNIKIMKNFCDSSVFSAVALLPALIVFGEIRNGGFSFYLISLIATVLFFLSASLVGTFFILLLNYIFPASKLRSFFWILIVFAGTAIYVLIRILSPERLVRPDALSAVAEYLNYLEMPVAFWLPSGWYYFVVFSSVSGFPDWIYFLLLIVFCVVGYLILLFAAEKFYLKSLSQKDYIRLIRPSKIIEASPVVAIVKNDLKLFFRDPQRWTQLILLFGIFVVYLVSIYKIPADTPYLATLVSFLNIGLVGFISAALSLRFVFPIFSIEAKTWWALISAPLTSAKIIQAKYILYGGFVFFLAVLLSVSSNLILKLDNEIFFTSVASALLISFVLSVMALCMGIRFPKTKFSNTVEIESSPGGIFFITASLFYIGLSLSMLSVLFQSFYKKRIFPHISFGFFEVMVILIYVGLNMILILYFVKKMQKDLINYEPQ